VPIIYNYQPDEITAPPPPPLTIDDDSLCWWGGTQRCFASVALATVIAAGTLSTALAQKIQQQTEDVVPAAASFVANDDYWINPSPTPATVNFVSRPYTFDAVEIVPPAHPPFVPDEDFWPALLAPTGQPPAMLLSRQPFAFDVQDLPATPSSQIDEDYWVPSRAFQTVGYQWLIIAQEQADVVSAPQVFHPDEDYWQFPPALASFAINRFASTPLLPFSSETEVVFTPPAFQLDEDYWTLAPAVQTLGYLWLPVAPDQAEFVSAPAGSVVDEDYWPLFVATSQGFAMNFQSMNLWVRTENYQEGIAFLAPPRGVGLQWLRCHGHAQGLFSRRR
jgi:hypothetical protein